jgi:hypothetical protein
MGLLPGKTTQCDLHCQLLLQELVVCMVVCS